MTPAPSVEARVLGHFETLMQRVADLHEPEFLEVDLTMSQAKVLYVVTLRPGIPMSALAAELGAGLPAASGLVDRLVSGGYLERHEDPVDRRQLLVAITAAGAAALDQMRELRIELMRRLLAGLSRTELDAMDTAISALDREALRLELEKRADPPADQASAHSERTPA